MNLSPTSLPPDPPGNEGTGGTAWLLEFTIKASSPRHPELTTHSATQTSWSIDPEATDQGTNLGSK